MRYFYHVIFIILISFNLSAQIIINEINYNPPESGQDQLEFIELYNPSIINVNIKDWVIDDAVNMIFPDTTIKSNGYLVICVNDLTFDSIYGFKSLKWDGGALRNDSEIITLKDQDGNVVDSVRYSDSGGWPSGPDGNGSSLELCRFNVDNYGSEYWKSAATLIGKKVNGFELRGSPGKPNIVPCSDASIDVKDFSFNPSNIEIFVGQHIEWSNITGKHNVNGGKDIFPANPEGFKNGPPATGNWTYIKRFDIEGDYTYRDDQNPSVTGKIKVRKIDPLYPSYPIGLVTSVNPEGVVDSSNVRCTLEGVVYGINFRPAGLQFTLIDNFNDGIVVFHTNRNFSYTVKEGDRIKVKGSITQLNGLAEIIVDTINVIGTNNPLANVQVVTGLSENTESQLIKLKNVYLVAPIQWTNNPLGFTVKVTDGINNYDVRIDNDCELVSKEVPAGKFDLTGIGYQNDITSPFNDGYQLYPRYTSDINPYLPLNKYYNKLDIVKVKTIKATGELDSIKVKCELRGIVYGIDFDGSPGIQFTMIDKTAGITVFHGMKSHNYKVTEGDEVIVQGIIDQFNGQAQIVPDTIILLNEKNTLTPARVVTTFDESIESALIKLEDVSIIDPLEWLGNGNSFNVRLSNGIKEFIMRIDNDCDLSKTLPKGKQITVTGIGNQFDGTIPFTEGYQIWPRYAKDIDFISESFSETTEKGIIIFPNPVKNVLSIVNLNALSFERIQILNINGSVLKEMPFESKIEVSLQPGIYILRLIGTNSSRNIKFLVD
ncbi:MAG: lamin tail domain-containing protein [Saprospiraceae bacterium]